MMKSDIWCHLFRCTTRGTYSLRLFWLVEIIVSIYFVVEDFIVSSILVKEFIVEDIIEDIVEGIV